MLNTVHLAFALQLHHEFSWKDFLENPNPHCESYFQVRRYWTSLANLEIDRIKDMVLLYLEQVVVQSNGKNTFYSMARVVFQYQDELSNAHMIP